MAEENKTKYSDAELAEFKAIIVKKIERQPISSSFLSSFGMATKALPKMRWQIGCLCLFGNRVMGMKKLGGG